MTLEGLRHHRCLFEALEYAGSGSAEQCKTKELAPTLRFYNAPKHNQPIILGRITLASASNPAEVAAVDFGTMSRPATAIVGRSGGKA